MKLGTKIKTIGTYNIHVNEVATGYVVHNYITDVVELEAKELPKCIVYATQGQGILDSLEEEHTH